MKKAMLLAVLLLIFSAASAQIRFEPGYYLGPDGARHSGLIRNMEWLNNPTAIDFKASEDANVQAVALSGMSEFSVGGDLFRKFDVLVDLSSSNSNELSLTKAPDFEAETAMLRLLSSGKLDLYEYVDHNEKRYFIKTQKQQKPEQLIFKEYRGDNTSILRNEAYKQQLAVAMADAAFGKTDFERLKYTRKPLLKLFEQYNGSGNATEKSDSGTKKKGSLNLKAVAGVNMAKLNFKQIFYDFEGDFGTQAVPMVGAELEYVLPINKNTWSVFLNPNYQSYKGQTSVSADAEMVSDYQFLEVPLGLRRYFYTGKDSRFFIDLGYAYSQNLGSTIKYVSSIHFYSDSEIHYDNSQTLFLGGGFGWKNLTAGIRLSLKKNILNQVNWTAHYTSSGIVMSYKLL